MSFLSHFNFSRKKKLFLSMSLISLISLPGVFPNFFPLGETHWAGGRIVKKASSSMPRGTQEVVIISSFSFSI